MVPAYGLEPMPSSASALGKQALSPVNTLSHGSPGLFTLAHTVPRVSALAKFVPTARLELAIPCGKKFLKLSCIPFHHVGLLFVFIPILVFSCFSAMTIRAEYLAFLYFFFDCWNRVSLG